MSRSPRETLDNMLNELRQNVLKMASQVADSLDCGVRAVLDHDVRLAQRVIMGDDEINQLRYKIEDEGVRVLALQQPSATDLRTVFAAMMIATELERIGDYAKSLARIAEATPIKAAPELKERLTDISQRLCDLLLRVVKAYAAHDDAVAAEILETDFRANAFFNEIMDDFVQGINEGREQLSPASAYKAAVAYNLARTADRTSNIAERVIYLVRNTFVEVHD